MIARLHLVEIAEEPWVPATLRDLLTESLQFGITRFGFYDAVAPRLAEVLRRAGSGRVVDLCSGGSGPWLSLASALEEEGVHDLEVCLTDKYVNDLARKRLEQHGDARLAYSARSVDATEVPDDLQGTRTLFTSLHHFAPEEARRVLGAARREQVPICVFEFTERSIGSLVAATLVPFAMLFTTLVMRPLTWQRLALTYLVPLIPLCSWWDGVVSSLRSYRPEELEALVSDLGGDDYTSEAGRICAAGMQPTITYLIGAPTGS